MPKNGYLGPKQNILETLMMILKGLDHRLTYNRCKTNTLETSMMIRGLPVDDDIYDSALRQNW